MEMPDDSPKHTPPQFFVESGALSKDHVVLTGDTLRHALTQRLRPKELFRVIVDFVNDDGHQPELGPTPVPNPFATSSGPFLETQSEVFEAEVVEACRKRLVGKIRKKLYVKHLPCALHLFPSLLKGDRFDLMIEKAVELGVSSITPVVTARTIPRLTKNKIATRKTRWGKVAKAAAEQSGRPNIPKISDPTAFKELMDSTLPGVALLATEQREIAQDVVHVLGASKEASIFIGPEGGFEAKEIKLAVEKGLQLVTLGPHILRAETASIAACAIIIRHMLGGTH